MAEEITQTHRKKKGICGDVSGYTITGPVTELSLSHGLLMPDFKNNSAGKHAAVFMSFSPFLCQHIINKCRNAKGKCFSSVAHDSKVKDLALHKKTYLPTGSEKSAEIKGKKV